MNAAQMALRGRDLAVQDRRDLVQLLINLDVLLGMALQELEDRRVDHGGSAVVRHVCSECRSIRGEARAGSLNFVGREKNVVQQPSSPAVPWDVGTTTQTILRNPAAKMETRPSIITVLDVNTSVFKATTRVHTPSR